MQNKVRAKIEEKGGNLLSIYFTAGFPNLEDSQTILNSLESAGVDFVEVGMPFSDPLADGPVIQQCAMTALQNGMLMQTLFDQVQGLPNNQIPKVWMGYVNQLMQFGFDKFLESCNAAGIDTVIVPDMPVDVYESEFRAKFETANVCPVFLITPQTIPERIRKIDELSNAFIYMVSDASITGGNARINNKQIEYFQRIKDMDLKNPCIIGFGISNAETYNTACTYAAGAIIGSAFLQAIDNSKDLETDIPKFIQTIR